MRPIFPLATGLFVGLVSLLTGCPDRPISAVPPVQDKVELKAIPVEINRNVDILWVIDNSKSMDGEQAALIANFPAFIDVLTLPAELGGLPNLHMGIVSTDGRKLEGIPGCGGNDNGQLRAPLGKSAFLSDILPAGGGARATSWQGDGYASLADAFSDYANLGTTGCGFEQHFQAVIDAIDPARNPGFLRDDAYLAIIFITDEDDCSGSDALYAASEAPPLGPLSSYRCFTQGVACTGDAPANENQPGIRHGCEINEGQGLTMDVAEVIQALEARKRRSQLILASIQGDTDPEKIAVMVTPQPWRYLENQGGERSPVTLAPSCVVPPHTQAEAVATRDGEAWIARPAVRLQALLDAYPTASTSQSICASDLTPALTQLANKIIERIGQPCILGELKDADPAASGLQADCQVSIVTHYGEADATEQVLPPCSAAITNNCWRIDTDADRCDMTDHHLVLVVERDPTDTDNEKHIVAGCALQ